MSIENHVAALKQEHRNLDEAVTRLEKSPAADSLEIVEMKRKRLQLKDRIETFETETRH